jgi:hypothetical protein
VRYFRHEVAGNTITIYPFVCWHIGALQPDEKFIKEMVARVKDDPLARWLYMGDAGECVTKGSKGDVFSQTMDLTAQSKRFAELVEPIKHKGLFGVKGNHGNRVFKETGMDFDEALCLRVGIPFMGTSCFWHLVLKRKGSSSICAFDIFTHHGIDSGVTIASKVTKAMALDKIVVADAIFSAHSHICCEIPPRHIATLTDTAAADKIKWLTTHEYICGCAYDSRTGYAESKGYPPILPAHLAVTFKQHHGHGVDERRQSCEIFRGE